MDARNPVSVREYLEVLGVILVITLLAWLTPLTHHVLGHVYLLAVILLCLRVGRGPVFFAAVSSALAWNYFFIPPRFSFQLLDYDDGVLLGIYFAVAIIAGQLIARIRAQEKHERNRQRQMTASYQLARALATGRPLAEALGDAILQAETFFGAPMRLLVPGAGGAWTVQPAGTLTLGEAEVAQAERFRDQRPGPIGDSRLHYVPLRRAEDLWGVLVVAGPHPVITDLVPDPVSLLETFGTQLALLLEREQLRTASERASLLAESERLYRTLFDSVSHELKTPLAVLRTVGDKLEKSDPERHAGLGGEIAQATQRLERLVANLLDQSRLESGLLRVRADWCDWRDIIQASRRQIHAALAGHPLQMDLPGDLPLIFADAPLMEQIVTNLLLNAVNHTPPGTAIRLTAGLQKRAGQAWVYLEVADRGPGLPAEVLGRLFAKFSRGSLAPAGGLGLGLSIVRGFMLAQGGEVTARNLSDGSVRRVQQKGGSW